MDKRQNATSIKPASDDNKFFVWARSVYLKVLQFTCINLIAVVHQIRITCITIPRNPQHPGEVHEPIEQATSGRN